MRPQPPANSGCFIVFEGGEGVGKSTQLALLAQRFRNLGREVVATREPGGTELAEAIRTLLLDERFTHMPAQAEALLFAAARADHAAQVITPALAHGAVVLCDRYIDSSVAYQGVGRGLGAQRIRELSLWATQEQVPDFTLVLDAPVEVGLTRAGHSDRIEKAGEQFHERNRQAFRDIVAANPTTHALVDAHGTVEQVAERLWHALPAVYRGEEGLG